MGLLKKLKSTLGLASTEERQETTVTVEYEPDATSEAAVKGTDEPAAAGTDAAGSTESITDEPPETPGDDTPSGAVEPGEAVGTASEATEPEPAGGDAASEPAETTGGAAAEPSVEEIDGIGPAYAERLREAGVETVDDLRNADVTELAEETGLSEKRIDRWVDSASE